MAASLDLGERNYGPDVVILRGFAYLMVALLAVFLINSYLTFWLDWPGASLPTDDSSLGFAQLLLYIVAIAGAGYYAKENQNNLLRADAERLAAAAAYVVRGAFFAVLLVGIADIVISFLRVEELLAGFVGETMANDLGKSNYRGLYVHYPLILISYIIAIFSRTLGFTWLAFMVVLAEFMIVISRFVFSYEQAFMGDLVRFWYASLFLFAAAHTLIEEGHVRVDVLYTGFSHEGKARANIAGCMLLGLPVCWTILLMGMAGKGSSIVSPLTSYEISQSGFGMYTKYLMAGFLLIFATSMILQFSSYLLGALAELKAEPGGGETHEDDGFGETSLHDIV